MYAAQLPLLWHRKARLLPQRLPLPFPPGPLTAHRLLLLRPLPAASVLLQRQLHLLPQSCLILPLQASTPVPTVLLSPEDKKEALFQVQALLFQNRDRPRLALHMPDPHLQLRHLHPQCPHPASRIQLPLSPLLPRLPASGNVLRRKFFGFPGIPG